jgi:hypothetical protein
MFSVANLLERAKAKAHIESDYRLAKIIGINQSALGNYRAGRSLPNETVIEQLCALSGDDADLVAAQIQAERAQTPEARTLWLRVAARMAHATGLVNLSMMGVILAISLIAGYVSPARATALFVVDAACTSTVYYVNK